MNQSNTLSEVTEEIAQFILDHAPYVEEYGYDGNTLEDIIQKHIEYNTLLSIRLKGKLVAVARFNWMDNEAARVVGVVIHSNYRSLKMLKYVMLMAKRNYPNMKTLHYERDKNDRPTQTLDLERILYRRRRQK